MCSQSFMSLCLVIVELVGNGGNGVEMLSLCFWVHFLMVFFNSFLLN